jgi:hypothetical protein
MCIHMRLTNSWFGLGALAALVAAMAAIVVAVAPVSASSHVVTGIATLSGEAEVPAVTSAAGGSFTAEINTETYEISYGLSSDAMNITQAHIHLGPADDNGPAVAFLFGPADPGSDGIDFIDSVTLASMIGDNTQKALVEGIMAGNAYVNVHTEANPSGEVRGQIVVLVPTAVGLPATGSGGLADAGSVLAPVAAAGIAGVLVLMLGASARVALRRRA